MTEEDQALHNVAPKRVALFFTGVDINDGSGELEQVVSDVAADAEMRGLFFEWGAVGDMDINDVVQGSPLHKALTGQFPDK